MNIDFFTFLGPNSAKYAEYLKYTCEVFQSGKHNINWKCVQSVGSKNIPAGYECVAKSKDAGHNSMNHGVALNLATKFVESEYAVFIDADMAIVYQDWDDIIIHELSKNDCFGAGYSHSKKYKNFPTVYLFAFRSYILDKVDLDFTPKIDSKGSPLKARVSINEAKYFDLTPNSIIKCDTGWKLPLIVRKAGFRAFAMPMVMMGSSKCQLPFENEAHRRLCMNKPSHMYEWHYKKKAFATHKQASRTQPIDGPWGRAWKKRVDLYIKQEKG
jgi:hypothetical protein